MISTMKLKDWAVILAVYAADKRLAFETQNPQKAIKERQTTQKKMSKGYEYISYKEET